MGPGIATADIIIWGIKSGLKLAGQARKAYVQATINRELTLPLPNFKPGISDTDIKDYFTGAGGIHLLKDPALKSAWDRFSKGVPLANDKQELIFAFNALTYAEGKDPCALDIVKPPLSSDAYISWFRIKQWAEGKDPNPSPAQRVLGCLIEVGIDFFANTQSVFDEKSASGRALKGFLSSIDGINFSEARASVIAKDMFLAALETIQENGSLLGADENTENLIRAASKGLIENISKQSKEFAQKDITKQEMIESWGQVVFRSMLASLGNIVLSNPQPYLGIKNKDKEAIVSSVGICILDIILSAVKVDPTKNEFINLNEVFSRESVDRLVKTGLLTLSEHPALMGEDHQGLRLILAQVAQDLSKSAMLLDPDILPELMRLILEKTALNMELLWSDEYQKDPKRHLLIVASKELLSILAKKAGPQGIWKPSLSKSQLLEIVEVVLNEAVQNPGWLAEAARKENTLLGDTVEITLSVLQGIPENRINAEAGKEVLKAAVKAVALRKQLLDRINIQGEEKVALAAILDTLVETMLSPDVDPRARWTLARGEVFAQVATVALKRTAEAGASDKNINTLKAMLDQAAKDLSSGNPWQVDEFVAKLASLAG